MLIRMVTLLLLLAGNVFAIEADIALFGDRPSTADEFQQKFYLDSTQSYSAITAYWSVGGGEWQEQRIDPAGLRSGYGSFNLPPGSAGGPVEFYLRIMRSDSIEFTLPAGAPDDTVCSYRITTAPEHSRLGFSGFSLQHQDLEPELNNAFALSGYGLAGFDAETGEPFGVLYNVGNYAPLLERDRNRVIAFNREENSVDVVDLDRRVLAKRIPLPDTLTGANTMYAHAVMDHDRGIYYLNDGVRLLKVELNRGAGQVTIIRDGGSGWISVPRQMEFNSRRDMLLLASGGWFELLDGGTLETLQSFRTSGVPIPHLLDDGRVLTIDLKAEATGPPPPTYSGKCWMTARYFPEDSRDYAQVGTINSPEFELPGLRQNLFVVHGMAAAFDERAGQVVVNIQPRVDRSTNRLLVWDYDTRPDSLLLLDTGEQYVTGQYTKIYSSASVRYALAGSIFTYYFSRLDLDDPAAEPVKYSPFSGAMGEAAGWEGKYITGLALPPAEPSSDLDGSGATDITDLLELIGKLGSGIYDKRLDVNGDSKFDIFDLLELLRRIGRK